uniref:mechanosensitive ion channel family protein n=1 Tax=Thaumasiovibrio occultus TaxID=1891184 RepID=UPI000B34AED6|nr:mechanosensitive ion channel family protein [Thaumasiovibrio occultus]
MEETLAWLEQKGLALIESNWQIEAITVTAVTIFFFIAWRILSNRLANWIQNASMAWGDAIWHAVRAPINWLIVVLGASIIANIVGFEPVLKVLPTVRQIAITGLIAWGCVRFIGKAEARFSRGSYDVTTVNALGKLAVVVVMVFAFLSVIQSLGVSISGILAFGGMGGLVVGMAAKDLLANFFGAIVIYFDRPFKVGDWIRSPDRQIEGTVESVGWRVTKIRTFDKRPLYVPNAVFSHIVVENPSRMSNRRIYEYVGLRYDDGAQVGAIVKDVKTMLLAHPEIDTNQTLMVNLDRFGPSSLDFFIYTFTKTTDWVYFHEIKQDVMERIMAIVDQHGAEIAFPTQTLHVQGFEPEGAVIPPAMNQKGVGGIN